MIKNLARVAGTLTLILLLTYPVATTPLLAATPPSGFTDALVTNVGSPTALAFTPDGRLLITQQSGQLRIYAGGALLPTPALDLSASMCTNSERGMLGVAVDPAFSTNHYIYLYYTFNKFGVCPTNDPTNAQVPVNRVSRFTLGDNNLAIGETMLLDNMISPNGNHNGGDLHFGADGYLYVSIGDGGADYAGDSGAGGSNDAARDQFMLLGKIMRITRDGDIPADNPFQAADSGRCNVNGRTTQAKCQETFAWGLRNPFRFTFKPGTSEFYINDVGQSAEEEIDVGQSGADYGWSCKEGTDINLTTGKCSPLPAGLVDPIFEYGHGTHPAPSPFQNCTAITGGAFVPAGLWPAPYAGAYLFADLGCSKIFRLIPDSGSGASAVEFATGAGNPSAMIFGPYNGTQALYYAANGAGQIRRIVSNTLLNTAPSAAFTATPSAGPTPLIVAFDSSNSRDPDGDPLSYDWDFGDGSTHATTATVTHMYPMGAYIATLTVSDGKGGTGQATKTIISGVIVLDTKQWLPLIVKQ